MNASFTGQPIHPAARVILATLGSVMIICGVIGNWMLIAVILSNFQKLRRRYVHNLFIVNLALADLFTLGYWLTFFVLDLILGYHPVLSHSHCVANSMFVATLMFVSVMTLVSISVNRYLHVCRTHLYSRVFTLKCILCLCALTWVVGLLVSLPPVFGGPAGVYRYNPTTRVCSFSREKMTYAKLMAVIFSIIPMLFVGYLNFAIFSFWKNARMSISSRYPKLNKEIQKRVNRTACLTQPQRKGKACVGSTGYQEKNAVREQHSHNHIPQSIPVIHIEDLGEFPELGDSIDERGEDWSENETDYNAIRLEESDECVRQEDTNNINIAPAFGLRIESHCLESIECGQPVEDTDMATNDTKDCCDVCSSDQSSEAVQDSASTAKDVSPHGTGSGGKSEDSTTTSSSASSAKKSSTATAGSTAGHSTGGSTAGPSTGGSTAGPSTGGSTAGHSTAGSTAGHSTGGSTVGPSTGGSTAGPLTGGSTAGPSTGGSTAGHSTGGSTTGPSTGGSTAGPSTAVISRVAPFVAMKPTTLSPASSCILKKAPSPALQRMRQERKKRKSKEVAFVRSLFVVFIFMFLSFIPYGISIIIGSFINVPPEAAIVGVMLLCVNNAVNWIVYGVMDKEFRKGYVRFISHALPVCCVKKLHQELQARNLLDSNMLGTSAQTSNVNYDTDRSCGSFVTPDAM